MNALANLAASKPCTGRYDCRATTHVVSCAAINSDYREPGNTPVERPSERGMPVFAAKTAAERVAGFLDVREGMMGAIDREVVYQVAAGGIMYKLTTADLRALLESAKVEQVVKEDIAIGGASIWLYCDGENSIRRDPGLMTDALMEAIQ